MNWEYLIIAIIFLIALYYVWQKIVLPFNNKKGGSSCGKGCGCGSDVSELDHSKD